MKMKFCKIASVVTALIISGNANSAPMFYESGYSAELLVTVQGSALNGLTFDATGNLFITDYNNGRVLQVDSPYSTGAHTAGVYATGIAYATDLTFRNDGQLFVSSSTGPNSNIINVSSDGSTSVFSSGYSYPTSIASYGNDLYVANSGDGTISRVDASGNSTAFVTGLSSPGGPFGLSIDASGNLYFGDHATGNIFSSDQVGDINLLGTLTGYGVVYTGVNNFGDVFISDVNTGQLHRIDSNGDMSLFASGFAGKTNVPFNGPHDIAFDTFGNMYISDADSVWRISSVPVPPALLLFGSGLIGLIGVARLSPRRAD
jgi:hypothetical protein